MGPSVAVRGNLVESIVAAALKLLDARFAGFVGGAIRFLLIGCNPLRLEDLSSPSNTVLPAVLVVCSYRYLVLVILC